jgi:hypothetical protein
MIERTLEEIACRILPEAAFVLATPESRTPEWPAEVIEVELGFDGPAAGKLWLRATPRFGAEVAANQMALEPDDPEAAAQAAAALAELLNIIAGALVAETFGTARVVRLGLPRARVGPPTAPPAAPVRLRGDEEHPIELAVELFGASP